MATPQPTEQEARVLWWNNHDIYVRCPFCDSIHHHGFTGYPGPANSTCTLRISHCGGPRSGSYRMLFPFDQTSSQAWYSIDKNRAIYVTGGEDPSEHYNDSESKNLRCDDIRLHAGQALSKKPRWHEARETTALDLNAFDIAVSDLVCGRYDGVQRYLDSSKEAAIFLHGVEEHIHDIPPDDNYDSDREPLGREEPQETICREVHTTGRTTLHFAACEGHPSLVRLLLERGADSNAQDADGRTPLVEACLWGRLENVQLLLHRADNSIPSVRNGQRYLPVDFARDTKENKEERRRRSGRVYMEDTQERDKDRKFIITLFEKRTEDDSGEQRSLWGSAFTRAPHDVTMVTFTAHFDIPNQYKTIGVLYRGDRFPTVAAMSGWRHSEWEIDNVQVAGKTWTSEVRSLCRRIGFRLQRDSRKDHGIPGQSNASHAEKQLIAYFVDQHFSTDLKIIQGKRSTSH